MSSNSVDFAIAGVLIIIAIILFLPIRRSGSKEIMPVDQRSVTSIFRDDKHGWFGFVYYNPDNPDVIVPKRYGIGWTVNFGHPAGKMIAIIMLIMLLLPVLLLLVPGFNPGNGCHQLGCIR